MQIWFEAYAMAYSATRYEYYVMVLGFDEDFAFQLAAATLASFLEQCRAGLIDAEVYDGEYLTELVLSALSDRALEERR